LSTASRSPTSAHGWAHGLAADLSSLTRASVLKWLESLRGRGLTPNDDELAASVRAYRGKTFRDRRDEAVIRLLIDCGLVHAGHRPLLMRSVTRSLSARWAVPVAHSHGLSGIAP
jgi:hypothetical protein